MEGTVLPTEAIELPRLAKKLLPEATELPLLATMLPSEATELPRLATMLPSKATELPRLATMLLFEAMELLEQAMTLPDAAHCNIALTTQPFKRTVGVGLSSCGNSAASQAPKWRRLLLSSAASPERANAARTKVCLSISQRGMDSDGVETAAPSPSVKASHPRFLLRPPSWRNLLPWVNLNPRGVGIVS
ncbi:MAG: hypothetical protein PHE55_18005 [Methylococcaceae bacterium]|nr:hypothetical protein [Methylococcaceae bacterium]